MNSTPENELWVVCPVCGKPNPPGTKFCRHCWGAVIHSDIPVTAQELEEISKRRQAYLRRRRISRLIAVSLTSLIVLVALVFPVLYYITDALFTPPQSLDSNSPPGEWTMFRHDLSRSGAAGTSTTLLQGKIKWTFASEGSIHSSPAVAYGKVYVGSRDYNLYALDAVTGEKIWEFKADGWIESSPAVANGIVYFGSNDTRLYAVDAHTGKKLWEFKTRYPIASSPAVANGIVYFGADDYNLYALDAATGTKRWDFDTKGIVYSSPVVANGIVYVGSTGSYCYALHALDGRLRLRYQTRYSVFASPVVIDSTVYLITDNGNLFAIDGTAQNWPLEHEMSPYWLQLYVFGLPLPIPMPPPPSGYLWGLRLGASSSTPAVRGGTLYAGAENKLIALDLESRQKRWEIETEGAIRSSPAVVDSTIYFGNEKGKLYAVDTATGEKIWEITLGDKITSSPAVVDGVLYIGSHDGNLYAIE